jgi:hypothetical protein
MIEKEIQFRKKRELGELISDSFEFIKQEYKPLFKLIFTYVLPFLILYGIVQVYIQMKIIGKIDLSSPETMMAHIGPIYLNLLLFSLFGIFVQSLLISALYSYIEIYVKKGKGNFDLSEITPLILSNGLLARGAGQVYFIISMIGLFMFIIPGFYFANTFSLVVIILIFEKKGLGNAMSRSWSLVSSQWWSTFVLIIAGIVIAWVIGLVVSIPAMTLGVSMNPLNATESGTAEPSQWYWALMGLTTIITSLFWVIPFTFLAFQYFNLDERTKHQKPLQDSFE